VGLILPIVFLGLMASLSPATIVVFVLVLGTTRARINAAAFLVGWGLSLTLVFGGSYAVAATGASTRGTGRTGVAVLQILLGVAFLVLAVRLWRRGGTTVPPTARRTRGAGRVMARMQGLTPVGALVVGVLKQPWAITIAAALVVVREQTTVLPDLIAFVLFTFASTASVGLLFLYYSRNPDEAESQLAELRDRVTTAGPKVSALVGILVGGFLAIHGLLSLT
jgi:hypothetical protein